MLFFWVAQAALHALRSDLDVVNDYVSDYANGPWGSLFTAATLVHGVGNLAIAVGLGYALGRNLAARAGALLFAVAALGLLAAGFFPTDSTDAPQTVTGVTHRVIAAGSFVVEFAALVLLGLALRADAVWRNYLKPSLALTVVAAITLGWLLVAILVEWPPGLPERAALLTFTVWEFTTAVLLARGPDHPRRRG